MTVNEFIVRNVSVCFTYFNIFFAVQMQDAERRFQETHEQLLQTQGELKAAQLEAIDSIRQINELQGNIPGLSKLKQPRASHLCWIIRLVPWCEKYGNCKGFSEEF